MRHRFRSGDRDALGELYDEHAQVLYRYALRVTGDWAEAEDVVSTTFLEAWRGREKVRPGEESLRPWLLGIATNVMRRNARARRRRDVALARVPERGAVPDFVDDLVAHLADTEQLRAARIALGKLRRRDREVFTLVVWAGLDYAAAAEVLGVPVGTVRSRLSRARGRLRELATAETRRGREDSQDRRDSQGREGRQATASQGQAAARGAASATPSPRGAPPAPGGPPPQGPRTPRAATRWPTVVSGPGSAPATPAPTPTPTPSPDSPPPGRFSVAPSLTQENHG